MSDLVAMSTRASVVIQLITGLVGAYGLTLPLTPEDQSLNQVLWLEMIVQVIEFLFYLGFLKILNVVTLTQSRYFDWFLSTPVMLFTTALYFTYEQKRRTNATEEQLTVEGFAKKEWRPLVAMAVLNAAMLLVGFAAEHGFLPRWLAFVVGTACLCGAFWILYTEFAEGTPYTEGLFWFMFAVWSSYGLAFLAPAVPKNVAYNVLDIIAKNFFGVFLFVQIARKSAAIKEKEDGGRSKTVASQEV